MTEWIAQDDWSTVRKNQHVRVIRQQSEVVGAVTRMNDLIDGSIGLCIQIETHTPTEIIVWDGDWDLYVPAKPAVVLPTEPGAYYDSSITAVGLWIVTPTGELVCSAHGVKCGRYEERETFAPFTRLEPVAETAKKVLDAVDKGASVRSRSIEITDLVIQDIAAQFGITDD